ncbi:hypothetical protein [Spongiibacter tropicus]|uniref:hypothetical protein n=1 Tax=Spongiibacter tropicus TaxID=454602 RepID=UPI0024E26BD3|nr:hypothetical protein [Spongiibacter tropicus]
MKDRVKLIAYWLYLWVPICLIGIYLSPGLVQIVVALILSALFYQAGTGILKRRNRDRKIAIGLLSLLALLNLDTLISALSGSAIPEQIVLIASFSLLIVLFSSAGALYLLKKDVAATFGANENA